MALLVLLLEAVVKLEQAEAFEGGDLRFLILELGALFTNDDDVGETSSSLGRTEVSSKVNWLAAPSSPLPLLLHPLVSLVEPGFVRGGAGECAGVGHGITIGDVGPDGIRQGPAPNPSPPPLLLSIGVCCCCSGFGMKITEAKLSSDSMLVSLCKLLSLEESVVDSVREESEKEPRLVNELAEATKKADCGSQKEAKLLNNHSSSAFACICWLAVIPTKRVSEAQRTCGDVVVLVKQPRFLRARAEQ